MAATLITESDARLEQRIRKALRERGGRATLSDVVVDTGLATMEAERLLRRMIGEYSCHLEVTDDGDLLYEFDPRMRRLDDRGRLRRLARRLGKRLWTGFSKFMKALIAVVMVVYVVLFVVLIIAAMIAASRGNSSSSRRIGPSRGGSGSGMFWFWFWMFGRSNDPWRTHRRHNPAYRRYGRPGGSRKQGRDGRPFYLKVFSFVLGPEPGDVEPLDDPVALLAFVREKSGAVTAAEVAERTGWGLERAEQALSGMVARYDGNLAVTDEGQLVFTFEDLLKTATVPKKKKALARYHERWEQRLAITGNTAASNVGIGLLNTFNLGAAWAAPTAILPPLQMAASGTVLFFLHWFPLAFSGLVFLIPLARYVFWVLPENRRRRQRNLRRAVYGAVFDANTKGQRELQPSRLAQRARAALPTHAYAPDVKLDEIAAVLRRTSTELGGDLVLDEDDESSLVYRFDTLFESVEAAKTIRRAVKKGATDEVRVVFSTRDERDAAEIDQPDDEEKPAEQPARILH